MWIEIIKVWPVKRKRCVTSLAEVWIEIATVISLSSAARSLPLRKCGLKYGLRRYHRVQDLVTSLAEVWIEMLQSRLCVPEYYSHFPCGSVDWNLWEAELRFQILPSLPLRKCGLKSPYSVSWQKKRQSLPLRKCGLKYCFVKWLLSSWHLSLPLRKCGLKYKINLIRHFFAMSLPLRKCGLKYDPYNWMSDRYPSLPLRKCGLKWLKMFCTFVLCWVTSLAEVWIEITLLRGWRNDERSLPLRKCGLKFFTSTIASSGSCHFPCGSVDWNPWSFAHFGRAPGHFPCGSVDWNVFWKPLTADKVIVTSLAEVWIEIDQNFL